MTKPEEIRDGLWTFPIVLPENPLKWLNCYVIKGERNLLIDTGFNRPECLDELLSGMKALELSPENTDVFLSHLHSDHTGNAAALEKLGYRIFMGSSDYRRMFRPREETIDRANARFLREGMPEEILKACTESSPAYLYRSGPFAARELGDGDRLEYGGRTLRCVLTPGHTPGHICLYDAGRKTMFLGDHILFDISPNICAWPNMDDSLGAYLDSLRSVRELPVELALPAHRNTGSVSMRERADALLEHHRRRLAETERIIGEEGPINAYRLAGKMSWKIRARNWDDFPAAQKSFAVSETFAHLDYLVRRGRIRRHEDCAGNVSYTAGE